jgi:site-specific recombinase XerC
LLLLYNNIMDKLDEFMLNIQNLSPATQKNYRFVLTHLANFYPGKSLERITQLEVKQYLATVKNAAAWNNRMYIFRRFFQSLGKKTYLADLAPKTKKELDGSSHRTKVLQITPEHIQWLLDASLSFRDKAMVAVMVDCGFRRGELVSITLGNVQWDNVGVKITCPKGKTGPRTVRGVECAAALRAWVAHHPKKDNKDAALFCVLSERRASTRVTKTGTKQLPAEHVGDALQVRSVNGVIDHILTRAQKAHPDMPHFHPHLARHVSATNAAKSGKMNTLGLKLRFGWSSNVMPDIYAHLTGGDADTQYLASLGLEPEEAVNKIHYCPRCNLPQVGNPRFCGNCASPMTTLEAIKIEEKEAGIKAAISDAELLAELMEMLRDRRENKRSQAGATPSAPPG